MESRIRTAVVGMGKMGLVHAAAVRTHPRVDLVAACDTSKFMTQALGKFLTGLRLYEDVGEMLGKESPDAVFIATPTGSHADIALQCARAGVNVFVEKPLASSLAEAREVEREIASRNLVSQVGYVCRYAPTFEQAKRILDAGALGTVQTFGSVKYSSDVLRRVENAWRFLRKSGQNGKAGGGVVNEFACHGIDLLVWMFGEPRGVTARLESWYSAEVEDYVHAVFDYGEFTGWIDSSWSMQDYRKPYNKIEVTGDNGKLIVTDSELRWMLHKDHAGYEAGWHHRSVTDLYEPVRMFVGDIMFSRQDEAFVDAVGGGPATRSPAAEALVTQRVLEAVREGDAK